MSLLDERDMLALDRQDLLEVLRLRFHSVPEEAAAKIQAIQQPDVLQRLILVAANAADWGVFLEELKEGTASFKLLGERFDPIDHNTRKG